MCIKHSLPQPQPQPVYGPLYFVQDYLGEPVPER